MDIKILLDRITPTLKFIARRHVLKGFYSEEDLYQEMCIYLLENYKYGLPIGKNESYVIKGCEFHIQNFLRKGRPKASIYSLDKIISPKGLTLGEILEDRREDLSKRLANRLTIDELNSIGLNEMEKKVITSLLKGNTVREVGSELGISHVMVLKYKKSIKKKWLRKFK